jgi:voltage-gated potassium channel
VEDRVQAWERRVEVPLLLLAVAFLLAYAWPVLDPRLDGTLVNGLAVLSWSVWAAFLLDFVVRVALARHRRRYVVRHWYDVLLVALPMLRPLRLLRLVALARLLDRSARANLTGRVGIYVGAVVVSAVGLGALAVLDAEQDAAGANITGIGDALWWAVSTVTTVGYGDVYPVTTTGRFVGVALMVVGVAAVGIATALLAAWLITYLTAEEAEAELEAVEAAEVAE